MSDTWTAGIETGMLQPRPAAAADASARKPQGLFGADGFTFRDFLDVINPLQHIPIVSSIYRAVTGDTIDPGARIAGGGLFGGPIGAAISLVSAMVEESTGKDPGDHALAMFGIELNDDEPVTSLAQAPQPDRVPPEMVAVLQPPRTDTRNSAKPVEPPRRETEEEEEDWKEADTEAENAAKAAQTAVAEPPHITVRSQHQAQSPVDTPAAIIAAHARGPQPGARSIATTDNPVPPQVADGRTWFPVHSQSVGAPSRGVGVQPVTQHNVTSKFGVARGGAYQGAAYRSDTPPAADWSERATAAYQKYFEMQQRRAHQTAIDMKY